MALGLPTWPVKSRYRDSPGLENGLSRPGDGAVRGCRPVPRADILGSGTMARRGELSSVISEIVDVTGGGVKRLKVNGHLFRRSKGECDCVYSAVCICNEGVCYCVNGEAYFSANAEPQFRYDQG